MRTYIMYVDSNQAKKALVSLAIETVLLKIGKRAHEEVNFRLYKNHHCYIPDCFENPEYLKSVLQDIYGKASLNIILSIKKELEEFTEQKGIDNFVTVISG